MRGRDAAAFKRWLRLFAVIWVGSTHFSLRTHG